MIRHYYIVSILIIVAAIGIFVWSFEKRKPKTKIRSMKMEDDDYEDIYKHADQALYSAKKSGRKQYSFYQE